MADSIRFTIGGKLAPSYRGALAQAESEALKANAAMNALIAAQTAKQSIVPRAGAAAVMMAQLRNAYNPAFLQRPGFFKQMADEGKELEHGLPGLNIVLRETLVIFREIGRGNWSRVPGSFSLIIQGLHQMRASLGIFGAIFTVTGAIIGGLIAAAALFAWHIHTITRNARDLAEMLDPLNKKFTEQAAAVREASKEHREFLDWLKKIGNETESLEEKTNRLIKSVEDHAQAEIELARARGAGAGTIEAMEEAQ